MPAPSLYEVQRLFWESVAVQPGRESIAPAFVRLVRGRDDSDRKTRIAVYSDAYFLRLRDVLWPAPRKLSRNEVESVA
jgi:hypothetical protein